MIGVVDPGLLNYAGLVSILTAMGGFLFKMQRDERKEREAMRQEHREERAARDSDTRTFLGNHMSGITKSLERVADRLEALEAEAQRAHEKETR